MRNDVLGVKEIQDEVAEKGTVLRIKYRKMQSRVIQVTDTGKVTGYK